MKPDAQEASRDAGLVPRVTVIVAAFNAAATIGAAVRSVLDQREVPLECIVVDDGSADGTAEIVQALGAADDRVVLLREAENGGASAARNRALDVSRGEWLAYLDADDRLLPGGLAAMVGAAESDGALAVVGQRISTDGERTWFPALYERPDIRRAGSGRSLVANPGLLYYLGPAGKLFHHSIGDGLRFEGRVLGDQPWVLRALVRAGDRISVVEDVVYEWWRPHPRRYVATLTTARERSAELGAQAVRMAGVAFDIATLEFERAYDPATRARMDAAYFARLIRADLAAQLRAAVDRRDPGTALMLRELEALIAHVPPEVAAGSDAVAVEVLAAPANGWALLPGVAKRAYWELLDTARRADPAVLRRARGCGLGTALRATEMPLAGHAVCVAMLLIRQPVCLALRWVRHERRLLARGRR